MADRDALSAGIWDTPWQLAHQGVWTYSFSRWQIGTPFSAGIWDTPWQLAHQGVWTYSFSIPYVICALMGYKI